jgi:hypothetical protein
VAVIFVVLSLAVALLYQRPASAQLAGQSFTAVPETRNATVGDTVTIGFRVRLHERDMLLDTIPHVVETPITGVRVLSVEKLNRVEDRVFQGRARLAFYRPGKRPVPIFGLTFMRVVEGVTRAILPSDSAFVEIDPILPAGDPPLKDIKELERTPSSPLAPLLLALVALGVAALYRRVRASRRQPGPAQEPEASHPPVVRNPYQVALDRLGEIERMQWPARGEVARYYEAVVGVLRDYLEDAEAVGARERTTSELLWALPPHLTAGGLRPRCHEILAEADLVKFAEVRPSESRAAEFHARAERLLEAWHHVRPQEEAAGVVDAVR